MSNSASKALTVFFLLAVGLTIGFLGGREVGRSSAPEERDPSYTADVDPADTPPATAEETVRSSTPAASKPDTVTPAPDDDPGSSLVAAVETLPVPEPLRGNGRIAGQVLDTDDQPLANVMIRVTPNSSVLPDAPKFSDHAPIEALVTDLAQHARLVQGSSRTTVTDSGGHYVIADLHETSLYDVTADLDDWSFKVKAGGSRGRSPGVTIDFVGRQLVTVPVEVVFADGSTPVRASVRAEPIRDTGASRVRLSWNRDRSELELRPGGYKISATESNDNEYRAEEVELTIELGVTPEPIRLVLEEQPGIRGTVAFPASMQPDRATVRLAFSEDGSAVPDAELVEGKRDRVRSYDAYEFRFMKLDPGVYTIGVQHDSGGPVLVSRNVTVSDRMVHVDLTVPTLHRENYLVVRATTPTGEAIKDFSVRLNYTMRGSSRTSSSSTTLEQPDGSRWALLSPPSGSTINDVESVKVRVSDKELGSNEVIWRPGDSTDVTVVFIQPAHLTVAVTGHVGSGYEDQLRVTVSKATTGSNSYYGWGRWGGQRLDENGEHRFGPYEPGSYRVTLTGQSSGGNFRSLSTQTVDIQSGENFTTVPLPRLYTLRVQTTFAVGTRIRLSRLGTTRYSDSTRVKADGSAEFDTLIAGEYNLSESGSSLGQMTLQIPAQLNVMFEAQTPNAVLVTITGASGTIEAAGLSDGDLIVSAGNEPVAGIVQLRGEAQRVAATEEKLDLRVLRGGSEIQLSVDPAAILSADNQQGRFDSFRLD